MEFETGKELYFENLISLRAKGTQAEINASIAELDQYFKSNSIQKVGPIITTTFTIEQNGGQVVLDMELLVPIDRAISSCDGYIFKPIFHLVNAAYTRHEGHPQKLQDTCNELLVCLQANSMQFITTFYNVMVKDAEIVNGVMGDITVDVYIGINPSTL